MHFYDFLIFGIYMLGVIGIGFYYYTKNESAEDYYVGSRSMSPVQIGLSIVATDVGGGFSIGLGGLGFLIGLSGSWMLFTGLVGAWLTAVFIIPRIKTIDVQEKMMTYPDFLRYKFNDKVALVAAIISGIGYLGFTGGQVLAGATLASSTLITSAPFGMSVMDFSLYVIAAIIIGYTVLGGLKAVVYTDMVQWIILLAGLIFIAVPLAVKEAGGLAAIRQALPPEFFTLTNVTPGHFINWMITIIPIWVVGMTLYQRMFACKNIKEAQKAWYIAGVFEYPIMAFVGVFLGLCARVLFPEIPPESAETGLPILIREVMPIGLRGVVIAAYFSAIMSTADSCLMASSGNFVNDIIQRYFIKDANEKTIMKLSQIITFVIGILAIVLATQWKTVLDAIMQAYAFMVAGLLVPTLGAYFWKKSSSTGAFWGMICGGSLTLALIFLNVDSMAWYKQAIEWGLNETFFGILVSAVVFIPLSLKYPDPEKEKKQEKLEEQKEEE